jgi:CheY-like chemotaxis protein
VRGVTDGAHASAGASDGAAAPVAPLVLLVDDSALVTEALATLLVAMGYRAAAAGSVAEAAEAASRERPDAVLLDLTLPDGDGLRLLPSLGIPGDGAGGVPVVLALTGHDDAATERRCLAAGCRAVLAKPVPAATLLGRLRAEGVAPR